MTDLPGIRRIEFIMGMPIILDVRHDGADDAVEAAYDWFRHVDAVFSTYKEDSEISRLNRGELHRRECTPDMKFILDRCEELTEITDGYFDMRATADRSLDPSGLVKGWSVDRAAELLLEAGLTNFAVSAGGDMRLAGCADPEPEWRVGIQHPTERDQIAAVVAGNDLAVATSGAYIRGDHVVDPHTGEAPRQVLSVTITGPVLADADAFATAAFAMDGRGPEWTARLVGYEAMTIMADGRVLSTAGFPVAPPD